MAYTLNGNDLGNMQTEDIRKTPQVTPLPIPLSDSDETDVFDFGGVIRTITITTWKDGAISTLQGLINSLESIVDGDQSTTVTYHSDLLDGTTKYPDGNVDVKITNLNYIYDRETPRRLILTLTLTEASDRG